MLRDASDARPDWVFLCGTARGGTTLLARLLDGHPSLVVLPWDSRVYPDLMDRSLTRIIVSLSEWTGSYELPAALAGPVAGGFAFGGRRALAARLARWLEDLPQRPPDVAALGDGAAGRAVGVRGRWEAFFDVLEGATGERMGSRIRVEKTPYNERLVGLLDRVFGAATRYVHIVRDPRAVVASWMRMRSLGEPDRARALLDRCVDWSRSVARLRHHLRRRPSRYHVIRYEDLAAAPVRVMTEVCAFLGVAPHAGLGTPTHLGAPVAANSSFPDAGGVGVVLRSHVDRFSEVLDREEIVRIEQRLHAQMRYCGYRPDEGRTRPEAGHGAADESEAGGARVRLKLRELRRRQRRWSEGRTLQDEAGGGRDGAGLETVARGKRAP